MTGHIYLETCNLPYMCWNQHDHAAAAWVSCGLLWQGYAQVQALEGLGEENARLAASNDALEKQLSSSQSLRVHPPRPSCLAASSVPIPACPFMTDVRGRGADEDSACAGQLEAGRRLFWQRQ